MKGAIKEMAKTHLLSWKTRPSEYSSFERIGLEGAILGGKAHVQKVPLLRKPKRLFFLLMEDGLKPSYPCFKGTNGLDE